MSVYIPARSFTSAPVPSTPPKAGPVGPGAGVLMTEFPLSILGDNPQRKMAQAWKLGIEVLWIRAAERVISGKFSTCAWHLEDPDGETIGDDYRRRTRSAHATSSKSRRPTHPMDRGCWRAG